VDAKIRPEPSSEEREIILRALEEQLARDGRPAAYRSPWRQLGIRENTDDEEPDEPL
jgi:hypothetical protein